MTTQTIGASRSVRALLVGPLAGPVLPAAREATPWPETCPSPDLVIAIDGGFSACRRRRWRTDLVVGDFDSLIAEDLCEIGERGIEIVRFARNKDFSDLDGALAEAVSRGATHITVIGVCGGRLDHQLAVLGSIARVRTAEVVALGPTVDAGQVADHDMVMVLVDGDEVRLAADRIFSVMALHGEGVVSIGGAQWPLDSAVLEPMSSVGLSNRSLVDGATVTCTAGTVVVVVLALLDGSGSASGANI